MIKIGVTGGIGSGKSVVCEIFKLYNIPIFNADTEAKKLNDTSPVIRKQLIHHFGNDIYVDDRLNRRKFADLIFNNESNLKIANSIIHPVVADCFIEWCSKYNNQPFIIIEAALLIEAGFHQLVDKVITVYAQDEVRIERVMKRDSIARDQVEARMLNQMTQEEKIKFSDFVIFNDNKKSLITQISRVIAKLSVPPTI